MLSPDLREAYASQLEALATLVRYTPDELLSAEVCEFLTHCAARLNRIGRREAAECILTFAQEVRRILT